MIADTPRILLIEDNPGDAHLVVDALSDAEPAWTVRRVERLSEGCAALAGQRVDAILLDLSLPDSQGLPTFARLLAEAPTVPILVLTGMHDEALALKAVREGAQDYLLKDELHGTLLSRAIRYAIERKRSGDALRESQQRYQEIFEQSRDGIFVSTVDGEIVDANPAFAEIFGYTRAEVLRLEASTLYDQPDDRQALQRVIEETGSVVDFPLCGRRKDGAQIDLLLSATMRRGADGAHLGYQGSIRDVTARRRADEALQRATRELDAIIDVSPLPIVVVDDARRVRVWNLAAEEVFGWTREEVLGQPYPLVSEQAGSGEVEEIFRASFAGEFARGSEVRRRRKDGTVRDLRVWNSVLSLGDGTRSLVAVLADVTEQKQLEEQLRQAQKMEAVGRLAGGIAHDFNNILTAVAGHVGLILEDLVPSDPLRADLMEVFAAVGRAGALTQQLLAFSRKQVLQPQAVDVNRVVCDLELMLRRLIGEDIALATKLAQPLGAVLVDRGQLEQVLVNLVVNARDAMPAGGRLLIETGLFDAGNETVAQHLGLAPGTYVRISVSDTGHGMDWATRTHIFEPFFTTKAQGKGTGLGLSTVYGIVTQSGGEIRVYSEPGIGSTFQIYFPLTTVEPSDALTASEQVTCSGTETVLLVEDEAAVRALVRRILQKRGYTVLEADGVQQARERCERYAGNIDVLLTDVVMPDGGGRSLAEELRRIRPALRVLFMSGYTEDAIANHGVLDAHASFISKPFSPDELTRKVQQVIETGSSPSARMH